MFIGNRVHTVIKLLMTTTDHMRGPCEVAFKRGLHSVSSKIRSCHVARWLILIDSSAGHSIQHHTVMYYVLHVFSLPTLPPWSRVRARSLLTCVSATSALSSASSSSCWSFLNLDRLAFACSSCREIEAKCSGEMKGCSSGAFPQCYTASE